MAEFKPKTPKESVNYTKEHPLKDLVGLGLGLLLIIGVAFLCFDFFVGQVVDRISFEQENRWFSSINSRITGSALGKNASRIGGNSASEKELLKLLDQLWLPFSDHTLLESEASNKLNFKVELLPQSEINAFTGLGGQFYFTRGLIDSSDSLNGLAFVACHELGHFFHRHVLKGSGRNLLMTLLFRLVGLGGIGDNLLGAGSQIVSLKFSRDAERQADAFALDCQQKFFGHVEGFDEFFNNTLKREAKSISFLSSHPLTQSRIDEMKLYAIDEGYSLEGELVPLEAPLKKNEPDSTGTKEN
jgi:hypothetical protein